MIFNLFFLVTISTLSFGFDKDFKTVNDRVPLEFNHLFESLKVTINSPAEKARLVNICLELDENLGILEKEHIFFLMKSEVIKNVLEYKHKKNREYSVTTTLIRNLEKEFTKKQSKLSSFSNWIWESIIAEFKYRESKNLITEKKFNKNDFVKSNKIEAFRFSRYLNFLLPWVDKMMSLSPEDFNKMTKEISWVVLYRMNERSLLFKKFSTASSTETRVKIFNIPSNLTEEKTDPPLRTQSNENLNSLSEESIAEKNKASQEIQNVSPDDLSPLSEEVTKEIEQKAP